MTLATSAPPPGSEGIILVDKVWARKEGGSKQPYPAL